jgi:hypothetical protein
MDTWYSKNLGDGMLAGEVLDRVKAMFETEHARAGCPAEMAVFVRHESEGRLHCEVRVFFSPATYALAKALAADPCRRPSPEGLGLLAGAEASWAGLFPERRC